MADIFSSLLSQSDPTSDSAATAVTSASATVPSTSADTTTAASISTSVAPTSTSASTTTPVTTPSSSISSTPSSTPSSAASSATESSIAVSTSASLSDSSTSASSSATSTSTSTTSSSISTSASSSVPSSTDAPTSAVVSTSVAQPTSASTATVVSQSTSDGQVVYYTTVVVSTPSTSSSVDEAGSSSKSFFQNTGAVAGVFTVVGIIVVVIIIVIITTAIRRRRAKDFDRDVAEAAADAAANAHVPNFTDDDDEYGYRNQQDLARSHSLYTGYSDGSHGTYTQPPMPSNPESFNMRELPPFDPYAASIGSGAGAAGVGAAGLNRARSNNQPYAAFAAPNDNYMDPSVVGGYPQPMGAHGQDIDLLAAAGLAGAGAGSLARGPSQNVTMPMPQQQQPDITRNKSLGTATLGSSSHGEQDAYYTPGYDTGMYQSPAQGYPPVQAPEQQRQSMYGEHYLGSSSMPDPYGGYLDVESTSPGSGELQNPHSPMAMGEPRPMSGQFSGPEDSSEEEQGAEGSAWHGQDEARMSLRDEEDYGYGGSRRVLKVANE